MRGILFFFYDCYALPSFSLVRNVRTLAYDERKHGWVSNGVLGRGFITCLQERLTLRICSWQPMIRGLPNVDPGQTELRRHHQPSHTWTPMKSKGKASVLLSLYPKIALWMSKKANVCRLFLTFLFARMEDGVNWIMSSHVGNWLWIQGCLDPQ